jgi:hypothetical protein
MRQTILTFITVIDPAQKTMLKGIFEAIRDNLLGNAYIAFPLVTRLHFASFVIANDQESESLLVFENNFDGDVSEYLDELLSVAGAGLHQIYQCCTDYRGSTFNVHHLKHFLLDKITRPNAFHIGNVGRAAKVVKANQQLREKLQDCLDDIFRKTSPGNISAVQLRAQLLAFAAAQLPGSSTPMPPHETLAAKVLNWTKLILFAIIGLPILLIPALIALPVLRRLERTDEVDTNPPSTAEVEQFIATENHITQNHLAVVTDIKLPKFRLYLLKFVLFAVNRVARIATKGKLSGIPSIHFAHWSIINDDRQMLFLSNYDGSWISYLDDFIDKAATGLTGIWSNSKGFPATRFLVLDGARDEVRFKAYSRNHQVPSLVWYSAYRDLTVQNIDKDSKIREGIAKTLAEPETEAWLKLF